MKKFLTFLLALVMCFTCLGGAVLADEHDHEHGDAVNVVLADAVADEADIMPLAALEDVLYIASCTSTFDEIGKTLTVKLEIRCSNPVLTFGYGDISVTLSSSTTNALVGRPESVTGYIYGEAIANNYNVVSSTGGNWTVRFTSPDSGFNSAYGLITIVYPINTNYLNYNWMRKVSVDCTGNVVTREGDLIAFDSLANSESVYICNHASTEWVTTTAATCEKAGVESRRCTVCSYVLDKRDLLPTDHTVDYSKPIKNSALYPYTEPTCTKTGRGAFTCLVCNKVVEMVIPALDHKLGSRYLSGGVYVQSCSRCGAVVRADNQCVHNPDTYVFVRTIAVSTCTEHGSELWRCPVDGEEETRELELAAHNMIEWEILESATCTTMGTRRGYCATCKQTVAETIPTIAHDWSEWMTVQPATCTTNGLSRRTCAKCGNTETQTISANGSHNWGNWTTRVAATCTSTGVNYRVCTRCNEEDSITTPMIAHTYGAWTTIVAPTCTSVGSESHACTVCNHTETRTVAPDLSAHSYGEWRVVNAKTCVTDGVKEHTCSLCGNVDSAVDPSTGHAFGGATTKGKTTTKTCNVCGYTEQSKTVKNGVEKTLTDVSGKLVVTGTTASRDVVFEITAMPADRADYYKQYQAFDRAYTYRLLVDGVEASLNLDTKLMLSIDASLEDYDVSLVVLRGGAFYTLSEYNRKGLDITIDGKNLTGVTGIFVVRGAQHKTNIVLPIVIAVLTLAVAGVAVYFVMSRGKKKNNTF